MAVLPTPGPGCASCARDGLIAEQARVLEEQAAAIGELRADVVALAAEVRELRRRLGRNSGNSSMAPSADDLPGRTPPPAKPKRGKGGRKPGGQPGFEGVAPGVEPEAGQHRGALPAWGVRVRRGAGGRG
jgi:transposase